MYQLLSLATSFKISENSTNHDMMLIKFFKQMKHMAEVVTININCL